MRKKIIKYHALTLFMVISLPVIYQHVHILIHHHNKHSTEIFQKNKSALFAYHKQCQLCSHEYIPFSVPDTYDFKVFINLIKTCDKALIQKNQLCYKGYNSVLRAPPYKQESI